MSARSSEFVMTPSLPKDHFQEIIPDNDGARIVPAALFLSAQEAVQETAQESLNGALQGVARTRPQNPHQQGNAIEVLRVVRRSIRQHAPQMPIEVARKLRSQPGSEVAAQSLSADLRLHSLQI